MTEREFQLAKPEVLFELARGGMGSVHLARVAGLGGFERFVIVKRLNALMEGDGQGRERFLSEARLAARIHHANVVGTHHVGTDSNGLYMVLDYVEGSSLQGLVDRAGLRGQRVPIPVALRIALDALGGLGAVHRATDEHGRPLGVVHRDVSLQNILVGRDGIARIADFGIAKGARSAVRTKTGSLVGKLLYLPPEYILREDVDATADIYMLGVTLWCAITGDEPWSAETEAQLMHRILSERIPPLASRLNEPLAPEIEALVARACDPNPLERFQSADKMAEAINALDRERGWVANQQEVAAFVEALMGVDLDRLQARIRELTKPLEAPQGVPEESKRPFPRAAVATLAALVLLGGAVAGWRMSDGPVTDSLVGVAPSTDVVAIAATRVTAEPTSTVAHAGTAQVMDAQEPAAEPALSPAVEKARPSSARPKKLERPWQPQPPDQISTTNPYR